MSPKTIMLKKPDTHIDEKRMMKKITNEFVDLEWVTIRLILVN